MDYQCILMKGYPGYKIDTGGNVWSCWKKRGLKGGGVESYLSDEWIKLNPAKDKDGYSIVSLTRADKTRCVRRTHRLAALAFISNPHNKANACHRDGDLLDNNVSNLYWGTTKENMADKKRHGTQLLGEKHPHAKLNRFQVQRILLNKITTPKLGSGKIAKMFNVNKSTILRIINGNAWAHLT